MPHTIRGKIDTGDFEVFWEGGMQYLIIQNATDPRFNGTYMVSIKTVRVFNYGKGKEYSLTLKSDSVYISGQATFADI